MGGSKSSQSSKPKDMTPEEFKKLQGPFAGVLGEMINKYVPQGTDAIMGGYKGPLTTQPTSAETGILQQMQQTQQQTNPAVNATLANTAASGMTPGAVNDFVGQLGFQPQQSLGQFGQDLAGASGTGAFSTSADNPFLKSYIEAAQRPTLQGLEETLSRTLPGRFTQAGHLIQPKGSSAFDRAAAIATRGATQEMGDIATRMSYQAAEAARGREADALGAELGRRGQMSQLEQGAKQQQLDRALQVPQIQQQQMDSMIKNLQAQALPRLISDLGIERGMEAFNNQVNALLSTLGITAGVTRPVISQESSGKSSSFQLK